MKGHPKYSGCASALLTPFRNGGAELDLDALAAMVDAQVAAGVDFLVPLGTTAETPCLTPEEKVAVFQTVKAHAGGLPLVAGAGTNSLAGTLANIALLEPYSPDAYLIVVPYYNKPTQQGLYEYYKAVAAATDKDIILYNVPGRTGCNLEASTVLRLASEVKNIVAVKEASGRYAQISEIISKRPEGFSVLCGNDDETLSLMATGADGVISVASNVAIDLMVEFMKALKADDFAAARPLHYKLMPLFKNLFVESNPIPGKAALALLGQCENSMRLPLTPAGEGTMEILRKTLSDLELI